MRQKAGLRAMGQQARRKASLGDVYVYVYRVRAQVHAYILGSRPTPGGAGCCTRAHRRTHTTRARTHAGTHTKATQVNGRLMALTEHRSNTLSHKPYALYPKPLAFNPVTVYLTRNPVTLNPQPSTRIPHLKTRNATTRQAECADGVAGRLQQAPRRAPR